MKAVRIPDGQRISNSRVKPKGDISGKRPMTLPEYAGCQQTPHFLQIASAGASRGPQDCQVLSQSIVAEFPSQRGIGSNVALPVLGTLKHFAMEICCVNTRD